jgi:hypothetical protein
MPADLERLAGEQRAAGEAWRAGDHSREIVQWMEDWLAEEAMVREEERAE